MISTNVCSHDFYQAVRGFDFNYGLASAAGLVVAGVALLLSALNFRLFPVEEVADE